MHITLMAMGSRGDVVPYATLGRGLRQAGHEVRLITFSSYAQLCERYDLELIPVKGDVQALLNSPEGKVFTAAGRNVIQVAASLPRLFRDLTKDMARALSSPRLHETDMIINQLPGCLFGYDLAEKIGVPLLMAAVMPMTRTRNSPFLAFPRQFSWPPYNELTFRLGEQIVWQIYRPVISRWRQDVLDMPPAPFWGHFERIAEQRVPVLNAFSEAVVARPADWGPHIHMTGYWYPPEQDWNPPDDLVDFLSAGPRPVFVGFGSMSLSDPRRVTRIVLDALARCQQRVILHAGWGGLGELSLPDTVFKIDYAPYGWLFPRMAAIVQHGGAGTVAFGLRSGVPNLVVPFIFDQFFWGERIAELGVGPNPLPVKRLSVDRLAERIIQMVDDPQMQQRAAALGRTLSAEDGIAHAIQVIESVI